MAKNELKCCRLMQESLGKIKDRQWINDRVPGQTCGTHPYRSDVPTQCMTLPTSSQAITGSALSSRLCKACRVELRVETNQRVLELANA